MTRVVLDVPTNKMRSFLQATLKLGIEQKTIQTTELNRRRRQSRATLFTLHKISTSFILFDWEFFCNELEYE
jgi:hypothetical protein